MKNDSYQSKLRTIIIIVSKIIVILFLPLVILLSTVQMYAFNNDFYMMQYEKNQVSNISKISTKDLGEITKVMFDYLKNDRDNLDLEAEINNKVEEVFGEREKLHMKDVKVLFQKGFSIRNYAAISVLTSITILFLLSLDTKRLLLNSVYKSSIISLSIILLMLILIRLDFMKYFTYFHKTFFDNDLWILNAREDVLIQMLPLEFFISISKRIGIWFLGIMLTIFFVCGFNLTKLKSSQEIKTII